MKDPKGVAQQQECQFVCLIMCDPFGGGCLRHVLLHIENITIS